MPQRKKTKKDFIQVPPGWEQTRQELAQFFINNENNFMMLPTEFWQSFNELTQLLRQSFLLRNPIPNSGDRSQAECSQFVEYIAQSYGSLNEINSFLVKAQLKLKGMEVLLKNLSELSTGDKKVSTIANHTGDVLAD